MNISEITPRELGGRERQGTEKRQRYKKVEEKERIGCLSNKIRVGDKMKLKNRNG